MTSTAAMATQRPTRPQASEAEAVLKSAGSAISAIVRRMAEARARARTRRILQSLDDTALKDIGIVRSRIDTIELGPEQAAVYRVVVLAGWCGKWLIEPGHQIAVREEIHPKQRDQIGETPAKARAKL